MCMIYVLLSLNFSFVSAPKNGWVLHSGSNCMHNEVIPTGDVQLQYML